MTAERPDPWPRIESELQKALSCPIDHLDTAEANVLPSDAGQHWDIPPADQAALRERGLPPLPLFTTAPQTEHAPLVTPDLAGEMERQVLLEDTRLYKLGFWGPSEETGVTGVAPGDGRVFYLLPAPITEDNLPEVLKPAYPGLYKPSVTLLNSSVTQFIETAWRWYASLEILRKVEEPLYSSAPEAELTAHYERLYAYVELIVDAAGRIDPAAVAEAPGWGELIRANSV